MDVDVALVPAQVDAWPPRVCIVVDELRASSTIVTALDLGCSDLYVTRGLAEARRLARAHDALLAGERRGLTPRGFDVNNSPAELSRVRDRVRGRTLVLSTSNGTAVLARVRTMPAVLVGCLLNAAACATAAIELARAHDLGIGVVAAGLLGRFAFEDAYAAGVIVERILSALDRDGEATHLEDGALAARTLAAARPDTAAAFDETETGRLLRVIDAADDIAFCAAVDTTLVVPVLRPGDPMRIEAIRHPVG